VNILVIGLGQLGKDLLRVMESSNEIIGIDYPDVDITSPISIDRILDTHEPQLVINAAAYTDVEGAESNREDAYAVNEFGSRYLARATAARNIPIVYFSTDFVFDGTGRTPYSPDDPTNPRSVYGASKLAGEVATIESNPEHYVLRTAWLYGPAGDNFIEKVIAWAQKNDSIKVVTDEVGSPTHTWDLAEATERLMHTRAFGLYHAVNNGACSRYTLAQKIVEQAGLEVELLKCASHEFPTKAQRPAYSVLNSAALESVCCTEMRSWQDALDHYLSRREALIQKG
jgi:dTDP-4-dehydrorhamnose reductase